MSQQLENYQLKVQNIQLQLKQNPTPNSALEYLEARIALLEGLVVKLLEAKQ